MLRIQNRHVEWPQHQIVIPGVNAKDAENRRIPFDPRGRLAAAPTGGWDDRILDAYAAAVMLAVETGSDPGWK
jgi:hypothetical protein